MSDVPERGIPVERAQIPPKRYVSRTKFGRYLVKRENRITRRKAKLQIRKGKHPPTSQRMRTVLDQIDVYYYNPPWWRIEPMVEREKRKKIRDSVRKDARIRKQIRAALSAEELPKELA